MQESRLKGVMPRPAGITSQIDDSPRPLRGSGEYWVIFPSSSQPTPANEAQFRRQIPVEVGANITTRKGLVLDFTPIILCMLLKQCPARAAAGKDRKGRVRPQHQALSNPRRPSQASPPPLKKRE
ncbi:hypothetical protein S40285_02368 [Stachybotrys chlorohalonatus IBT 40285]|uniref:Uncharacterized protein n=1 Tax=Stachybotrys chlorohalonatus (strain IBT 40285) TaxID=1283841 RepID=A0A084QPN8_STAC4|nr:hypothetical protein S40285_02368 [Stachybotrys chlorohalonata IBT 40285]